MRAVLCGAQKSLSVPMVPGGSFDRHGPKIENWALPHGDNLLPKAIEILTYLSNSTAKRGLI